MVNSQETTGIKYADRDATPLKFHKFTRFVSIPLGFLSVLVSFIGALPFFADPRAGYYASIDALYDVTVLILLAMCFIGFFGWKRYSWYAIMTYFCLNMAYQLLYFVVSVQYGLTSLSSGLGSLLGSMVYLIPAFIYYKKRKQLFCR